MKISFNNLTGFAPTDVFWTIIGQNQAKQFAHITVDGNGNSSFVPMQLSDNVNGFANYSLPLSQCAALSWPNNLFINSARIYVSIGGSLPIQVQSDGNTPPTITYAPPSITNPGLAGYNLLYDFSEFAFMPAGGNSFNQLNFNTSSVDFFCIPILAGLSGGNLQQALSVGYSASRMDIFTAISTCKGANFAGLIIPMPSQNPSAMSLKSKTLGSRQDTTLAAVKDLRILSPANVFSGDE